MSPAGYLETTAHLAITMHGWHESSEIHVGACVVYWKLHGLHWCTAGEGHAWCSALLETGAGAHCECDANTGFLQLSVSGTRDIFGQPNSRHFVAIIEMLASYDPVLQELIKPPKGSVKYLSPSIQNELIYILSQWVQKDITAEINQAPFFFSYYGHHTRSVQATSA